MDTRERALAALDDDMLVRLTQDLVRIRTINPPGDEAKAATFVADWMRRNDMAAELVTHAEDGRASVVGGLDGMGERRAVLFSRRRLHPRDGAPDTVPPRFERPASGAAFEAPARAEGR